jgi:hypothetical protein
MAKQHVTGGRAWHGAMRPLYLTTLIIALLALGSSCGGNGSSRLDAATAPQHGAAPGGIMAGLPRLPEAGRQASQTALVVEGVDSFDAYIGAEESGSRLVLDGANAGPNGLAWAVYEFTTTETAKFPVELRVAVGEDSAQYWLALSDYSRKSWRISGPFNGLGSLPAPADTDLVAPTGRAYAAVISHNPDGDSRVVVEELELKLSQNGSAGECTAVNA